VSECPQSRPPVRRVEKVPAAAKPAGEIIQFEGGQVLDVTIISPQLHGYVVHWSPRENRSCPCSADDATCKGCVEKWPSKNKWYLFVWTAKKGCCWVELTDGFARQLEKVLEGRTNFRGARITIYRSAKNRGRLNCTLLEWDAKDRDLPPDREPIELLHFLWDARRKQNYQD
jgi:hypothetical protein